MKLFNLILIISIFFGFSGCASKGKLRTKVIEQSKTDDFREVSNVLVILDNDNNYFEDEILSDFKNNLNNSLIKAGFSLENIDNSDVLEIKISLEEFTELSSLRGKSEIFANIAFSVNNKQFSVFRVEYIIDIVPITYLGSKRAEEALMEQIVKYVILNFSHRDSKFLEI